MVGLRSDNILGGGRHSGTSGRLTLDVIVGKTERVGRLGHFVRICPLLEVDGFGGFGEGRLVGGGLIANEEKQ